MKLHSKNDVYTLMNSTIPAAALGAAIETGLLWLLATKPMSAPEVVQVMNIPGKRGYYWLQLLERLGILDHGPDGYTPSTLTREAILDSRSRESWQHLALDERERSAGVGNLPLLIREPGSIWAAQGLSEPQDYVEKMRASPVRAREFTRMLYEVHQHLANQISALLDLKGVQRMMDLGGGSGVVSMALMRNYPTLTSTVVDMENVCAAGREIAVEEGLSERISYYPADFVSDEFPSGFDLVLQCDVGVFGLALFTKLYGSLKQGGRLIFVDHFSPTENAAPVTRVEWTFLDSLRDPNFGFPTLTQVKTQLTQAGFEVAPGHQTLGSGWIVFQAFK